MAGGPWQQLFYHQLSAWMHGDAKAKGETKMDADHNKLIRGHSDVTGVKLSLGLDKRILIVQPEVTTFNLDEKMRMIPIETLEVAYIQSVRQGLVHVGFAEYDDRDGMISNFQPCGGNLLFPEKARWGWLENKSKVKMAVGCTECNMQMGSYFDLESFGHVIRHLMIKQFVIHLKGSLYISCGHPDHVDLLSKTSWIRGESKEKIAQLGTIAFHPKSFTGVAPSFQDSLSNYGLGYILMPGLNTVGSCAGLDNWLKILFYENIDQVYRRLADLELSLCGPTLSGN